MVEGLQFVMIHVPNVAAARAFYVERLGMEVEDESPTFVQLKGAGGGASLGISEPPDATAEATELWWFVADADAEYARLQAQDVPIVSPPADMPFGRTVEIRDPVGRTVHLLQLPQHG